MLFCGVGGLEGLRAFNTQLGALPHPRKIVCAGNHDLICEALGSARTQALLSNCTYIENSETRAFGLRVYGAPWSVPSRSRNKGFQSDAQRQRVADTPDGVDILVTHGYTRAVHDPVLARVQPRAYVSGHIHRLHGAQQGAGRTLMVNAAIADDLYHMAHAPVVFDLPAARPGAGPFE